jgi:ABC-2 type transport system permease protein
VGRLIMGPIPGLGFSNTAQVLSVMLLGSATFSALGLLIGCAINPQQIGLMFSSIIGPMIFFGCMYYPWKGLDAVPVMKYAVLVNPLVYVAEGMRATLTPAVPHMDLAAVGVALLALLLLFWWLGLRAFMKRAVT